MPLPVRHPTPNLPWATVWVCPRTRGAPAWPPDPGEGRRWARARARQGHAGQGTLGTRGTFGQGQGRTLKSWDVWGLPQFREPGKTGRFFAGQPRTSCGVVVFFACVSSTRPRSPPFTHPLPTHCPRPHPQVCTRCLRQPRPPPWRALLRLACLCRRGGRGRREGRGALRAHACGTRRRGRRKRQGVGAEEKTRAGARMPRLVHTAREHGTTKGMVAGAQRRGVPWWRGDFVRPGGTRGRMSDPSGSTPACASPTYSFKCGCCSLNCSQEIGRPRGYCVVCHQEMSPLQPMAHARGLCRCKSGAWWTCCWASRWRRLE